MLSRSHYRTYGSGSVVPVPQSVVTFHYHDEAVQGFPRVIGTNSGKNSKKIHGPHLRLYKKGLGKRCDVVDSIFNLMQLLCTPWPSSPHLYTRTLNLVHYDATVPL
jgi:hypothetical protein